MLVIGVVGGAASGKSLVSDHFRRLGAEVIDVDQVGHEVLRDPDVEAAAGSRWGSAVFGNDGHIDRSALAGIVFASPPDGPRQLAYLEQLVHPRIAEKLRDRISRARAEGRTRAVVLDAAVLLKAGWDRFCDKIVLVAAPRELRLRRARRRGWTEQQFAAREAAQPPLSTQRSRADVVISNASSPEQMQAEIQQFWSSHVQ